MEGKASPALVSLCSSRERASQSAVKRLNKHLASVRRTLDDNDHCETEKLEQGEGDWK